jgi:hypothetical protein
MIMKICIATPMYGGNAKSQYVASVSELINTLARAGHQVYQIAVTNESLITRARNTLVYEFLKTDSEALLFIDGDHGFVPSDILEMVESGKDVIGAIYPMKTINWHNVRKAALAGKENLEEYSGSFAVNLLPDAQSFKFKEPFKVLDIGTGMLFITRKAFDEVKPICKVYLNNTVNSSNFGDDVIEYFTTAITDEKILLSEDYAFCAMWRSLGNDVWAAPWVRITHAGDYNYSGNFLRSLEVGALPNPEPVTPTE